MYVTKNSVRAGFNLSEIMLAVVIIAMTFLPIIGVMSTSFKATAKDDAAIRAMDLCQEKLNTALQFPFRHYDLNLGVDLTAAQIASNGLELDLFDETIKSVQFRYVLRVEDRPGNFSVRERNLDVGQSDAPATWNFNALIQVPYNNIFYRYKMTVFWREPGEAQEKFYSLVTFRADLKN